MKKYACVLKMVDPEFGLSKEDIINMMKMLSDSEYGYIPLDLESPNANTVALGFIDVAVYEELDFEEKNIIKTIDKALNDMNQENASCEYELSNGYIIYMAYNIPS